MIIRALKQDDFRDLQANIFVRDTVEDVEGRTRDNIERMTKGEIIVLVAEIDGEVVGNMQLTKYTHPLYAHRIKLDDVVVCHRFWKRGIARQLFDAGKYRIKSEGIKIIETSVRGGEPAEEVYNRLGFVEYGRLPSGIAEPWSGNVFDEVMYVIPWCHG
ncbi:MAG: GNAT family N-acetyltransferase [Eubacteriales bacterium]|nr:GNAT family N-acetyltransferase [Eubacteriales bacterium]